MLYEIFDKKKKRGRKERNLCLTFFFSDKIYIHTYLRNTEVLIPGREWPSSGSSIFPITKKRRYLCNTEVLICCTNRTFGSKKKKRKKMDKFSTLSVNVSKYSCRFVIVVPRFVTRFSLCKISYKYSGCGKLPDEL